MSAEIKVSRDLQVLAAGLDDILRDSAGGERMGFCLVVFPLNRPGGLNYVGNAKREDMCKMLEQLVERWKSGLPDPLLHEKH